METKSGGVVVAAENVRGLDVLGIRVEPLLRGEDTAGVFSQYHVIVPPGGGPPPHVHSREEESFFVIEGEFEILCGEQVHRVGAGTSVYLPRSVAHAFKNVGENVGRLLGTSTPAGHERFFEDVDALAQQGLMTPEEGAAVCRRHGIELILPG